MKRSIKMLGQVALIFAFIGLTCTADNAGAITITPNPNPEGNTITVSGSDVGGGPFINHGTIEIIRGAQLNNQCCGAKDVTNESGGYINNSGFLLNAPKSTLINAGLMRNRDGGAINNNGFWNNIGNGTLINEARSILFGNDPGGVLINSASIENYGKFYNRNTAKLANDSVFVNYSGALSDNDGTFENYWSLGNPGTLNNTSIFNNGAC